MEYFSLHESYVLLVLSPKTPDEGQNQKERDLIVSCDRLQKQKKKENDLNVIEKLVDDIDWTKYITAWANIIDYKGILFPSFEQYLTAVGKLPTQNGTSNNSSVSENNQFSNHNAKDHKVDTITDEIKNTENEIHQQTYSNNSDKLDRNFSNKTSNLLRYRVTCYRSGKHSFASQEAACAFGGILQDRYNWIVDLDNYDVEVVLKISDKNVMVLLTLTERSLHRRNITHFGSTTLRSTMAYNMLRLANTSFGDIVVDPLCGSGSISIEGSLSFPGTIHICGDIHKKSVKLAKLNIQSLIERKHTLSIDVLQWNALSLPLNNESVDVVVTDLPFGKRVGSKFKNKVLYFDVLKELSRVVKSETGRGVFLTTNRNTFNVVLKKNSNYWKRQKMLVVNVGGLRGFVYLLLRTSLKV